MIYFFSHPGYFYSLIAALLMVSLFSIFSMGEEDRKARKKTEDQLTQERNRRTELERNMEAKALEYKESVESFAKTLQEKDAEFAGRTATGEALLAAQEGLKSEIAGLKQALAQMDDNYKKAASAKENLQKELALSNQMYNGLKEQNAELEEKFSQLFEEFLKEQKKNLPDQSSKITPEPLQPQQQVKLPKVPNLRSTVQQENDGGNVFPAEA